MSHTLRTTAFRIGGVIVCLTILGWVVWSFFHSPVRKISDGRAVRDIPIAEVAPFSGSQFRVHREAYLANLETYRRLEMRPAESSPDRIADLMYHLLLERLKADPQNKEALDSIPSDAVRDLASRVSLVLSRASGMPFSEYSKRLGDSGRLVVPANLPKTELSVIGVTDLAPNEQAIAGEKLRSLFEAEYQKAAASPTDVHRLVGWSFAQEGFKVGMALRADNDENVLADRLDESGRILFRGLLARGSYIFYRELQTGSDARAAGSSLVRFEGVIVVEDGTGDRYPLWMSLFYDATAKHWWITNVYRMVSVRAAILPPLVY